MSPGGHLVHLIHWLHAETEHGGPLAILGIVIGGALGLMSHPLMRPNELCLKYGTPPCPDELSVEALVTVLGIAVVAGALGAAIGWILAQGKGTGSAS